MAGPAVDYGQYASVGPDGTQVAQAPTMTAEQTAAVASFNQARDAFKQGDYQTALTLTDQAIASTPSDSVLHEFKGTCQFALGEYQQAAATLYAVLSAGPGWDWTTMANLYPSVDVYTQQLRATEAYRNAHPDAADVHFVLGYEYLVQGFNDAAAKEFKSVAKLQPTDQLAAQLVKSLAPADSPDASPDQSAIAQQQEPPAPVDATVLVGNWNASQPDGAKFGLNLGKDNSFTWQFTRQGKTQDIKGTYQIGENNLLVLKGGDNNNLVGQVAMLPDNQMQFKLPGDNPSDPGLKFRKT